MTESSSRPVRVWNYRYALFCSFVAIVLVTTAMVATLEPASRETTDSPLWALALFGWFALLGVRPWFLGLIGEQKVDRS